MRLQTVAIVVATTSPPPRKEYSAQLVVRPIHSCRQVIMQRVSVIHIIHYRLVTRRRFANLQTSVQEEGAILTHSILINMGGRNLAQQASLAQQRVCRPALVAGSVRQAFTALRGQIKTMRIAVAATSHILQDGSAHLGQQLRTKSAHLVQMAVLNLAP